MRRKNSNFFRAKIYKILKLTCRNLPGIERIIDERDQLRRRIWDFEKKIECYSSIVEEISSITIINKNSQTEVKEPISLDAFENPGYCYCCGEQVTFKAAGTWWRDQYRCQNCNSLPRERALMFCLEKFYPNWKELIIHESSPVFRGSSLRIRKEAPYYIPSYYYPDVELGSMKNGYRCENLENLTFRDNSIDIHITQDVIEHVFNPGKAFKEIARTMKPGGMHIFTVPIVNKEKPTEVCATINDEGEIKFLRPPEYHGDPINSKGALVVTRWGYDICDTIYQSSGLLTKIVKIDSLRLGIRAEYIEVLISTKP